MADKEYIERGAVLRLFDERYITAIVQQKHDDVPEDHRKHWKGVQSGTNWCRNTVLDAPAADVVEVVRCKDCKYYKHFKGLGNWCHRRIRSDIEYHTKTTDFCSFGERKE